MLNQIFDNQSAQQNNEKTAQKFEVAESKIGQGADDGWLWTKTKAALAAANDLRDAVINVDVENSVVTLRGTVTNQKQKLRAAAIARKVVGVKAVKNTLNIFPN